MAATKTGNKKNDKFGAKASFIRSQPETMSAKEVVEGAKKVGLKVTVNHVYNIRAASKTDGVRSSPKTIPLANTGTVSPSRLGHKSTFAFSTATYTLESQLRLAIAQMGLQRAREIFRSVESLFEVV